MRSSEEDVQAQRKQRHVLLISMLPAAACLVAGCSSQSTIPLPTEADAGSACAGAKGDAQALVRSVEGDPLYAAASGSGVQSCSLGTEGVAQVLRYVFHDGSWLHVKRDARIEYAEREARLTTPLAGEDALAILRRTEQVAFGAQGCGIDWQSPEITTARADGMAGAVDTVFRGDTCNCQARVRRDGGGHVVGLVLRSAC